MNNHTSIDDFHSRALNLLKTCEQKEAFALIFSELESCDDKHLIEYAEILNKLRDEMVLDWIEKQAHRIVNVSESWGHLAASSRFNWETAERWLTMGRPLSLIALTALIYCTTIDERLNQSIWMRQIQPKLLGYPGPEIIARRLQEYLSTDNVHRTRGSVQHIIENIFDVSQSQ